MTQPRLCHFYFGGSGTTIAANINLCYTVAAFWLESPTLIALPVSLVYLALQKYMSGGLTVGGVKG